MSDPGRMMAHNKAEQAEQNKPNVSRVETDQYILFNKSTMKSRDTLSSCFFTPV